MMMKKTCPFHPVMRVTDFDFLDRIVDTTRPKRLMDAQSSVSHAVLHFLCNNVNVNTIRCSNFPHSISIAHALARPRAIPSP